MNVRRSWRGRLFALLLGTSLGFGTLELVVRAQPLAGARAERLEEFRRVVRRERLRRFDPHPYLGYDRRRPEAGGGALDHMGEAVPRERTPGVPRIACLGGSTTEGGPRSWPGLLRRLLERRRGDEVEVENWGVAGWNSAESLVNWVLRAQDSRPDLVLVHHGANDVRPRLHGGFRSDYSHCRTPWQERRIPGWERFLIATSEAYARHRVGEFDANVQARVTRALGAPALGADGALAPETAEAYARNLRTLCRLARLAGARPALLTMPRRLEAPKDVLEAAHLAGIDEHNERMRAVASAEDALLIDLARSFAQAPPAEAEAWFVDIVHLTTAGEGRKAELVAEALEGAGWP